MTDEVYIPETQTFKRINTEAKLEAVKNAKEELEKDLEKRNEVHKSESYFDKKEGTVKYRFDHDDILLAYDKTLDVLLNYEVPIVLAALTCSRYDSSLYSLSR